MSDRTARARTPAPDTPAALESRLIEFAAAACQGLRQTRTDLVGLHLAKQLLRCATSPAANYAEARAAESRRDFVHKMQICLKELREAAVWLRLIKRLANSADSLDAVTRECDQLIAIFVASIKTARRSDTTL